MNAIRCQCGAVELAVDGPPIMAVECHCASCREAGPRLSAGRLSAGRPVQEPNGGTRYVMQRRDRVRVLRGADRLASFRLHPDAATQRIVAECCGSPMWLDFRGGHWVSLYAARWPQGTAPRPSCGR